MSAHKYAIFFPEGDGYLFCRPLGNGMEGVTSIVRSITNNKDYVRKKTKPTSAKASHRNGIRCPEVELYEEFPKIPTLVRSQDFNVLPKGHAAFNDFKSTSIIFEYCNGGSLDRFFAVLERERILPPQALVLQLIDHLMEAVDFVHRYCEPPVIHQDVHEGNIFLHFPNPDSKLPDFLLGDFGLARRAADGLFEVSGNPVRRRMRDLASIQREDDQAQQQYAACQAAGLTTAADKPPEPRRRQVIRMFDDINNLYAIIHRAIVARHQQPETAKYVAMRLDFLDWLRELGKRYAAREDITPGTYNQWVDLHQYIRTWAEQARQQADKLPDLQWTRQDRYRDDVPPGDAQVASHPWKFYNEHLPVVADQRLKAPWQHAPSPSVQLFETRHELLRQAAGVPGPWRIARVRTNPAPATAAAVLHVEAVEEHAFNLHVPRLSDNPWKTADGRHVNGDDVEMEGQLVATAADGIGVETFIARSEALLLNAAVADELADDLFGVDQAWPPKLAKQVVVLTLQAEDALLAVAAIQSAPQDAAAAAVAVPVAAATADGKPVQPATQEAATQPAPVARRRRRRQQVRTGPNVTTRAMARREEMDKRRVTRSMARVAAAEAEAAAKKRKM
ncbi:hypothetical protein G647_01134 [Cladophialophora carrionii CBS 160.54]|uniref:non-specific serine/threonine protein kinase n=1 Tax=Cladophialophora carrionii CBS 160.54 TaxID=1279043 RepID=V9DQU2_9EURO|nr:uncharacterized protein G647_01134 [Cladophialophora carrionii CBS 160.54]ETI28683.1 hypothetical protein G647_01134 [Cladophialophora carrionii CBS 160.54]